MFFSSKVPYPIVFIKINIVINNILKYHGISFKYILSSLFEEKNYYSPVLSNSEKSNEILKYKNDSIESYYMRLKRRSRKRNKYFNWKNNIKNKKGEIIW